MPESHSIEDDAVLYVLDELPPPERRRFETRLADSTELRALVRELEEGAVGLAITARRHQPPEKVWEHIEQALAKEAAPKLGLSAILSWIWPSGWAVAAACMIGWLLHVAYLNRSEAPASASSAETPGPAANSAPNAASTAPLPPGESVTRPRPPALATTGPLQSPQSRNPEPSPLQWQLAELSNRVAQLSRRLKEQDLALTAPGQFRFIQLTPKQSREDGVETAGARPQDEHQQSNLVSTNLQQALFLGIARELGWLGPTHASTAGETGGLPQAVTNPPSGTLVGADQNPVDYVDLRRTDTTQVHPAPSAQVESDPSPAIQPLPHETFAIRTGIPGFVSGNLAILAFDASVVPAGASLTFWTANSSGQYQALGGTRLGNNALVVTVPFLAGISTGGSLTVLAQGAGGFSNLFQFAVPGGPGGN